jgi:hypothetical protein
MPHSTCIRSSSPTLEGGALTQSEEWPIERYDNLTTHQVVDGAVAMHGGWQHVRHMHIPTLESQQPALMQQPHQRTTAHSPHPRHQLYLRSRRPPAPFYLHVLSKEVNGIQATLRTSSSSTTRRTIKLSTCSKPQPPSWTISTPLPKHFKEATTHYKYQA